MDHPVGLALELVKELVGEEAVACRGRTGPPIPSTKHR
jgi:hypothetical protein